MYSGIIRNKAEIIYINDTGVNRVFSLHLPKNIQFRLEVGSSIALNGVCFTIKRKGLRTLDVEAMAQTLDVTTASDWSVGDELNFEGPLKMGEEIGGHMIFGHIDDMAVVTKRVREGNSTVMTFEAPDVVADMIVSRASIAVDGVSLTVVSVDGKEFIVSLLPATLESTSLENLKVGDKVNIEIDMLMRYAYQQIHKN